MNLGSLLVSLNNDTDTAQVCVCVCVRVCMCVHTYTHTHARTHARTHTQSHAHNHTHILTHLLTHSLTHSLRFLHLHTVELLRLGWRRCEAYKLLLKQSLGYDIVEYKQIQCLSSREGTGEKCQNSKYLFSQGIPRLCVYTISSPILLVLPPCALDHSLA